MKSKRGYRVWTHNAGDTVTCWIDWTTKGRCMKYILARWKHKDGSTFISAAKNATSFRRANGL